jgi:hypothetical protein
MPEDWNEFWVQTSKTAHRLTIKSAEGAMFPIDVSFVVPEDAKEIKITFSNDWEASRGIARLMTITKA